MTMTTTTTTTMTIYGLLSKFYLILLVLVILAGVFGSLPSSIASLLTSRPPSQLLSLMITTLQLNLDIDYINDNNHVGRWNDKVNCVLFYLVLFLIWQVADTADNDDNDNDTSSDADADSHDDDDDDDDDDTVRGFRKTKTETKRNIKTQNKKK